MSTTFANLSSLPAYCLDFDRSRRLGVGEVVYGEGKTEPELLEIVEKLWEQETAPHQKTSVLVTRLSDESQKSLQKKFPAGVLNQRARTFRLSKNLNEKSLEVFESSPGNDGFVAVVCAGTTDLYVAEEVVETLTMANLPYGRVYDVGVAGLHRLLARGEFLRRASVIIVIAGMEGALPSVLGGLFSQPIIAVPTSVGYGVALKGQTALHGMLTSCAPGISVMNIDNGFGAAFAAFRILKGQRL